MDDLKDKLNTFIDLCKETQSTGEIFKHLIFAVNRIEELEQRLAVAMDLLQQIHDCHVNWVESTIPKGGMNPDNPRHRWQVVGTQHISYTRLHNIAAFLHQNIDMKKGE